MMKETMTRQSDQGYIFFKDYQHLQPSLLERWLPPRAAVNLMLPVLPLMIYDKVRGVITFDSLAITFSPNF